MQYRFGITSRISDSECNTVLELHSESLILNVIPFLALHSESVILNVIPFWKYIQKTLILNQPSSIGIHFGNMGNQQLGGRVTLVSSTYETLWGSLWSLWGHWGVTLASGWGLFAALGSLCGHFGTTLGSR